MDIKSLPHITRKEFLDAIKEGITQAILTMTETGDGYTGPICFEPFMEAIKQGTKEAIYQYKCDRSMDGYEEDLEKLLD
mgnify:CR=1 FL=1